MARLCLAQICMTLAFCVLSGGMCSLDLAEGIQDSNHFGSCLCQLSCGDQGENNSPAIVELISLLASTRTSHNDPFQRVLSQLQQQLGQHLALTNEIKSLLEANTISLEAKLVSRLFGAMDERVESFSQQLTQLQQSVQQLTPPQPEYKPAYRVFRVLSPQGLYRLSQIEARAMCLSNDAKLATVAQLEAAWKHGMDECSCGWLDDGSSRYPIQWPRNGCGGGQAGLQVCNPAGYSGSALQDAYCFA